MTEQDLQAELQLEANQDLTPGTVIGDHFEIISYVGEGGTSKVFKARDLFLDRIVAIKMLRHEMRAGTEDYKRFRNEALALKEMSHPNILTVYGLGEWEGRFFLAIDYIEGRTLAEELALKGALPLERFLRIAEQCLRALGHAHAHGIVHRDIKPGNIMLQTDSAGNDLAKIVDFGIAKSFENRTDSGTTTSTELICGSPYYMSPEQCMGRKLDHRSDLYSMACVLHEMITGERPFDGETVVATMMMHTTEPFPLISRKLNVPSAVQVAILRAACKDREERLQSAQEFVDALNDTASGIIVPTPQPRHNHRPRNALIAAGTVAVFALGAASGLLYSITSTPVDHYARMKKQLPLNQTTVAAEAARIRGMSDHARGAKEYEDLLNAVESYDRQIGHPHLFEAAVSAAEYLTTVPEEDRLSLKSKIDDLGRSYLLKDATNYQAADGLRHRSSSSWLVCQAHMDIAEGRGTRKSDCANLAGEGIYFLNQDKRYALTLLDTSVKWAEAAKDPDLLAECLCYRASAFERLLDFSDAEADFTRAVHDAAPHSQARPRAYFGLAVVRARQGDMAQAKRYFDRGCAALKQSTPVNSVPMRQALFAAAAMASKMCGSKDTTVDMLRCAVTEEINTPSNPDRLGDAFTQLAENYYNEQDLPRTLKTLDEAIEVLPKVFPRKDHQPALARAYLSKADYLRAAQQWQAAHAATQRAYDIVLPFASLIVHSSNLPSDTANFLAVTSYKLGQSKKSDALFQQAMNNVANLAAHDQRNCFYHYAARWADAGNAQRAAHLYRRCLELSRFEPDWTATSDAQLRYADVLISLKRYDEAEKSLLAGKIWDAQRNPNPGIASNWEHKLSELAFHRGNHKDAVRHLSNAVAEYRKTGGVDAILCDKLAALAYTSFVAGDKQQAAQAAAEALSITRTFPRATDEHLTLTVQQVWTYQRLAGYFQAAGDKKQQLAMFDATRPYFFVAYYQPSLAYSARVYAALLKEAGRTQDALAIERSAYKAGG